MTTTMSYPLLHKEYGVLVGHIGSPRHGKCAMVFNSIEVTMTLADLLSTLSEYDSETDVVVALRSEGDYRDFAVKECQGISLEKEGRNIIALEIDDNKQFKIFVKETTS